VGEALECLGGNGFIEESVMPRLYRDAPLNSIWEGSGNVTALDLLRALGRPAGGLDVLQAELDLAAGTDRRLDLAIERLGKELGAIASADQVSAQYQARRLAGLLTVVMQAALLVRFAPPEISDAFCATRLDATQGLSGPGVSFGMMPAGLDVSPVLDRITPVGDR
jgi:putative acyl-CoA dehydrogenase